MTRDDLIREIQSRPKNEIICNRILVAIDGSQSVGRKCIKSCCAVC